MPLHKAAPKNIDVLLGLARCAEDIKALPEADRYIQLAESLDSDAKQVRHMRARWLLAEKRVDEALELLEANIDREDLHGESIDLWLETLKAHKRELYLCDKLTEYVKRHPKRPEFVFGLGMTLSRAGEIDNARKYLQQADKMLPNNHRVLYELGVLERQAGHIQKSQEIFEKVLELKPAHPAALRTFGNEHKYAYGDKHFVTLNSEAANLTTLQPMEQVQIHFALGKAYDDVGELSTAFRHFAVGGAKKRKQDPMNEKASARMFSLVQKLVDREAIEKSNQTGCQDETPVFILGMPRSGTSLMEQILSAHPDIYGGGELKYMTPSLENISVAGRRLKFGDVEPAFDYDINANFEMRGQWFADRLKALAAGRPVKRVVDKMPGNFNYVGLIHAILPKARIIHSRRHPMETCLSCYRILFAEGHQWTYNLTDLGRYYRRYWNIMQHWREQFPDAMLEVRYEDNVADVEGQARKLIDYLGVPWNDNCLNFHKIDRPVKTASAAQVRKPIYNTSTNRWRKYEPYLGPLLDEIGDIVEAYEAEIAHLPKD